ncbi:MAG: two pore domain potassium channel family protein [Gemmatimonadetes bacterium]|nr:two pore domain potassium channel family protein [Gemmatimonadota bacterium]
MIGPLLLYTLAGMAVLTLALYDVFTTILHHWGGAGPVSGRIAHELWRLIVRLTGGVEPEWRRRILGRVGPLLIPATVTLWAGLVILGFALLYLPRMPQDFHADRFVADFGNLADAFYYSGITFFTVGYGDIVPLSTGLRMLAMLQGGAGFALITLVIGYFTSVYGAYSQQKSTAASVYYQTERSADASRLIAQHLAGGSASTLTGEVGRLRDALAAIRTDYTNYPILHYFIAAQAEASLARLLFVTQDLGILLDSVIDPQRCPAAAGLGRRSGLLFAATAVQDGIAETLLRERSRKGEEPTAEDRDSWVARFERAQEVLRGAGVPVREEAEALQEYCDKREEWEPLLRACTRVLGEEWEDVTGQE